MAGNRYARPMLPRSWSWGQERKALSPGTAYTSDQRYSMGLGPIERTRPHPTDAIREIELESDERFRVWHALPTYAREWNVTGIPVSNGIPLPNVSINYVIPPGYVGRLDAFRYDLWYPQTGGYNPETGQVGQILLNGNPQTDLSEILMGLTTDGWFETYVIAESLSRFTLSVSFPDQGSTINQVYCRLAMRGTLLRSDGRPADLQFSRPARH